MYWYQSSDNIYPVQSQKKNIQNYEFTYVALTELPKSSYLHQRIHFSGCLQLLVAEGNRL